MARAGYCSECQEVIWLQADGGCIKGHGPEYVSGAYDVTENMPEISAPVAEHAQHLQSSPLPPSKPNRGGRILVIAGLTVLITMCGVGVYAVVSWGPSIFGLMAGGGEQQACSAGLRSLDNATLIWASESDANDPITLDSMEAAKAALSGQVPDFDAMATCPGGGTISVTDGDFTCTISDHNYETR